MPKIKQKYMHFVPKDSIAIDKTGTSIYAQRRSCDISRFDNPHINYNLRTPLLDLTYLLGIATWFTKTRGLGLQAFVWSCLVSLLMLGKDFDIIRWP